MKNDYLLYICSFATLTLKPDKYSKSERTRLKIYTPLHISTPFTTKEFADVNYCYVPPEINCLHNISLTYNNNI